MLGYRATPNYEIADKIKIALEDEIKMQDLAKELRERGYAKSADTYRPLQIQSVELQGISQRSLEKGSDYKRAGEDQ